MATDMANYNKPNGNKKNIGVIIVTVVFAIIGMLCIIIGYGNDFLNWLKTFGIVILVLVSPVLVYVIFSFIIKKVKDM